MWVLALVLMTVRLFLPTNEPESGDVESLEPLSEPILSRRHLAKYQRRFP